MYLNKHIILFLFIFIYVSNHLYAQSSLELISDSKKINISNPIIVIDGRDYQLEVGKLISLKNKQWTSLNFKGDFTNTISYIHDSLLQHLNMTQQYLMNIKSLYVQENRVKNSSMKYGRIAFIADYYVKNKDLTYTYTYTADTSLQVSSYLLPITISTELKTLFNFFMIRCKNSISQGPPLSIDDIKINSIVNTLNPDVFSEIKTDAVYFTWDQLRENNMSLTEYEIKGIKGLGNLILIDSNNKKIKQSIFELYAYSQKGILYKCTKFGSFPLLNYNNNYYFVGYDEKHYNVKEDDYQYKKIKKRGGRSLRTEDIESQKYLFKINARNGESMVVCSILPDDDYINILMAFKK